MDKILFYTLVILLASTFLYFGIEIVSTLAGINDTLIQGLQ